MHRRIFAIVAVGLSLSQIAAAADWPTKPVRIISPTTPGGVSDTFARMLAEGFADMFGQRFYVENHVGAGGLIGVAAAANGVLRRPAVRGRIQRDAIETKTMSPEEYTAFMESELQSWGPLAKQLAPQN